MQDIYDTVKGLNGEIVVFSSETNTISKGMADKQKLGFPIVRDEELKISRAFGLAFQLPDDLRGVYASFGIDIPKFTERDVWELPMPARYVIDKDGVIRAADVDPDYTKRPEPEATLDVVKGLG